MTILIGYLPAPEGEAALDTAFAEAKLRNTDVVVLNSPRRGTTDSITQIQQEDAERILAQAAEHGVTARVEQPAHEDDLVQTLNEWAEQEDADLIIIGLRKRSAIGKFILGSQAQRILLEADVPVLTVKAGSSATDLRPRAAAQSPAALRVFQPPCGWTPMNPLCPAQSRSSAYRVCQSCDSREASSSARCTPLRSVRSLIWVRQE